MAKKKYPMLSELSDDQKGHLAWRLDRFTAYGYLTSLNCVRGNWGDFPVDKIFSDAEMKPHQAKIHATKVVNFKRK